VGQQDSIDGKTVPGFSLFYPDAAVKKSIRRTIIHNLSFVKCPDLKLDLFHQMLPQALIDIIHDPRF